VTLQPEKPRILIADDHPANRLAFQTLLEPHYTVHIAEGGEEALRCVLQYDYAVILLDVRMPRIDGFEVAQAIRQRERTRHTPIVFMSAYDQTVLQARKGFVAGATDFIFSPVDEELLKHKVATYVQMTLRNDALRLQVEQLEQSVRALQAELSLCATGESVWAKINSLERQIEEIRRDVGTLPAWGAK
jgi:PleD family two-component response regulator